MQAWYTTQTVDLQGATTVDDKLHNNGGFYVVNVFIPEGNAVHVTGSHLGDGLRSVLYHVIIIVDLARVQGQSVGALADYVAMPSLAETQAFEACAPISSISDLVSQGCGAVVKTSEITSDLAYLHGLYRIDPRVSFAHQLGEIVMQMSKKRR